MRGLIALALFVAGCANKAEEPSIFEVLEMRKAAGLPARLDVAKMYRDYDRQLP